MSPVSPVVFHTVVTMSIGPLSTLFGKQHWVTGEHQTEILNLIPKHTENS